MMNIKACLIVLITVSVIANLVHHQSSLSRQDLEQPPLLASDSPDLSSRRVDAHDSAANYSNNHGFVNSTATAQSKNSSTHKNNNNSNNKPHLVIHIGPAKMGTTTLQDAFVTLGKRGIFEQDKYLYSKELFIGKNFGIFLHGKCQHQLRRLRLQYYEEEQQQEHATERGSDTNNPQNLQILKEQLRAVPCWNQTLQALQHHANSHTNLFFSSEPISFYKHALRTPQYRMVDWPSLHLTLGDQFHLLVVFGYRRYPEWFYSCHHQQFKYGPGKKRLTGWTLPRGKQNSSLPPPYPLYEPLPSNASSRRNNHMRYVDHLKDELDDYSDYVRYKIFNFHDDRQYVGLVSRFLCTVLPDAPKSCQYSLDHSNELEQVANSRESLFYDALTLAAYHQGRIDSTRHDRHLVVQKVQYHQEHVLNQTAMEFPLQCPTKESLQGFLNLSLELEAKILPDFKDTQNHIATFWKQVDKKKYCWIDTAKTLQSGTWQTFFQSYHASSPHV